MSSTGAAAGSPLGAAVARVFGPDGRPVGGAFLAAPDHLVTVAHVVNDALGRPQDAAEHPTSRLRVDFPLVAPGHFLAAEVVRWVPPVLTGGTGEVEDVAGLRLLAEVPGGAAPVALSERGDLMDLRAVVLGFPAFSDDGVWSVGRLRGRQAGGWVQIDNDVTSQFALEGGFSGVPVWDVDEAAAVGVVVAAWRGGSTQSGYLIPASGVYAAWPRLRAMARPPSPFPGLRAFGEQDAGVFFGRGALTGRIVQLTRSAPVVTVVGPSGVGKSSLLHAGVLPALRDRGDAEVLLMRPSEAGTPLRSLALALDRALAPAREAADRTDEVARLTERLRQGAVREIAGELLRSTGRAERLLLVVDQWEEAFAGPPEEADELGRVLAEVLRPESPLRLLAALRADLLGAALQRPATAPLVHDQWNVTVAEMETAELHEVVTRPVESVRTVRYEDGLVDRLLADVGDAPGRLPLVQFALAELWRSQRDGLLTHDAYEAMGTVRRALAHHADVTWTGLSPDERQRAARLLVQLVRPVPGAAGFTRRLAPRTDFSDAQWAVAGRLATARLVVLREPERTGDGAEASMGVELAHDTLFTHWPLLRELAEKAREFRLWQEDLRRRADRWRASGHQAGRLLTGAELRDARRWQQARGDELSGAERRFIAQSRARRRALWRRFGGAAVVLVVIAGTLWFRQARSLSSTAADSLAAVARSHRGDAYAEAQLALRAYRTRHTEDAARAVRSAYWGTAPVDRLLPDARTGTAGGPAPSASAASAGGSGSTAARFDRPASLSADGTVLVTATPHGRPAVWRLDGDGVTRQRLTDAGDAEPFTVQGTVGAGGRHAAFVQSVGSVMPGSRANACSVRELKMADTSCLTVYDLRTGSPTQHIPVTAVGKHPQVEALSIDPGAHAVGAVVQDPSGGYLVRTWDLRTGRLRTRGRLPFDASGVSGLWLAPGGSSAVVLTEKAGTYPTQHTLTRLDVGAHEVTARRLADGMHDGGTAVSGDGLRVAAAVPAAAGEQPTGVRVWDLRNGRQLARIDGLPAQLASGHAALDRTGSQVFLSWINGMKPPSPLPDDASAQASAMDRYEEELRDSTTVRVTRWRVGQKSVHDTGMRAAPTWTSVRPLGDGQDDPVVLFTSGMVGLVLPRDGAPPPRERLFGLPPEVGGTAADVAFRHLCGALAGSELSNLDQKVLPDGAFTGDPCS